MASCCGWRAALSSSSSVSAFAAAARGRFTRQHSSYRLIPRRGNAGAASSSSSTAAAAAATSATTAVAASSSSSSLVSSAVSTLRIYYTLSKFRLSLLVTSTAACGYLLGSGSDVDWTRFASMCGGVLATSGAASALNHVYEGDRDALMKRTRRRPIPSGRIGNIHATGFALALLAAGEVLLYTNTGVCSAALAGANVVLYAGIYTPLKV